LERPSRLSRLNGGDSQVYRQYLRTLYVYVTILRSYVLSKLLQIIGQIFAFDKVISLTHPLEVKP